MNDDRQLNELFTIDIEDALDAALAGGEEESDVVNGSDDRLDKNQPSTDSVMGLQLQDGNVRQFDRIRSREDISASAIFDEPNYVGRNLHRVEYDVDGDDSSSSSLLFCHVPIFLRYSTPKGPSCQIAYSASAGAILAMHHFNTGDGSVVKELEGINKTCNIRMTTEIIDTGSSPINAVRDLTRMLTRGPESFANPQPCAIFGSQISSVTSKMASLTGVFDLFQVSSSAMSTELEDPLQ